MTREDMSQAFRPGDGPESSFLSQWCLGKQDKPLKDIFPGFLGDGGSQLSRAAKTGAATGADFSANVAGRVIRKLL